MSAPDVLANPLLVKSGLAVGLDSATLKCKRERAKELYFLEHLQYRRHNHTLVRLPNLVLWHIPLTWLGVWTPSNLVSVSREPPTHERSSAGDEIRKKEKLSGARRSKEGLGAPSPRPFPFAVHGERDVCPRDGHYSNQLPAQRAN